MGMKEQIIDLEDQLTAADDRAVAAEDKLAKAATEIKELNEVLTAASDDVSNSARRATELGEHLDTARAELERTAKALVAEEHGHANTKAKLAKAEDAAANMALGQLGTDNGLVAPEGAILAVRAVPKDGFCRAGKKWPSTWSYVIKGDLTATEIISILSESRLETRKLAG